jgi:type I restriction enzyme M protein
LNAVAKMRPFISGEGGGRVGLVHNGSPLFTGDAGSGESEIRRFLLDHDYLDAIVALPTDMFYNTNIATYLWFLSNRKPKERQGKVMLIDASAMGLLMKKNLGKKRLELSDDCQRRIVQAYHAFKPVEWEDQAAVGGRRRALKAKVLPASHFFYRRVTIERPLRMRFEVTPERLQEFRDSIVSQKAPNKVLLDHALDRLAFQPEAQAGGQGLTWMSVERFNSALQGAASFERDSHDADAPKLKAKDLEIARKFFGVRDKKAEIVNDDKGKPLPDADLRDAEYIPFSFLARHGSAVTTGVQAYFDAEVKPHWTDAWINTNVIDESDGKLGVVGCEINFSREFYVYKAPRSREAIKHDIEVMEKRFMEMLKGVAG